MYDLTEIILDRDELEALRFADLLKLSHEEASAKMNISRATFGRIVSSARMKTADGILNGKAIRISKDPSGSSKVKNDDRCTNCGRSWEKKLKP